MPKYEPGRIMKKEGDSEIIERGSERRKSFCCLHKNIVPLEIGFAIKSWPNGYKEEANYNFAVGILTANVVRIRSYLCLECKQEIKAPNPGQLKKDRL